MVICNKHIIEGDKTATSFYWKPIFSNYFNKKH